MQQQILLCWQDLSLWLHCFGDKNSLNQLQPLQKVLFWWQDLSQSSGRCSSATPSPKGSFLVSIMWRGSILMEENYFGFYYGDKISTDSVLDANKSEVLIEERFNIALHMEMCFKIVDCSTNGSLYFKTVSLLLHHSKDEITGDDEQFQG